MDARSGDPVVAAVLGEAQADADTVGLLLAGSRGAGQADAQSDYDFVWVLSDLAYQDRAERGGPWDVARRIGGHKVELSFASPAVLRELAERPSWRNSDYATAVVL